MTTESQKHDNQNVLQQSIEHTELSQPILRNKVNMRRKCQ
ncbi:hypothetical protein OIU79_010051 [Salix purpurea]|uniref:Uncharacterized protein n=1 Tax=Salix purpurea TaxID=77065 RepID=A0A9Q0QEM2_SALPP|nr:hypothetical protein OIU79_010051 [Salix purpurea]